MMELVRGAADVDSARKIIIGMAIGLATTHAQSKSAISADELSSKITHIYTMQGPANGLAIDVKSVCITSPGGTYLSICVVFFAHDDQNALPEGCQFIPPK